MSNAILPFPRRPNGPVAPQSYQHAIGQGFIIYVQPTRAERGPFSIFYETGYGVTRVGTFSDFASASRFAREEAMRRGAKFCGGERERRGAA